MFQVQVERADGSVKFFTQHGMKVLDSADKADWIAARLWELYGDSGRFARFSVVDSEGNRVSDWEC